jgi:hypothetical protein
LESRIRSVPAANVGILPSHGGRNRHGQALGPE